MARNLDDAIREEEEREYDESIDLGEQKQPKEYDDDTGENTAPTTGLSTLSGMEFVCTKCGARSLMKHAKTTAVHCGRQMQIVDREAKRTFPFGTSKETAEISIRKVSKARKPPLHKSRKAARKPQKTKAKAKPLASKKKIRSKPRKSIKTRRAPSRKRKSPARSKR